MALTIDRAHQEAMQVDLCRLPDHQILTATYKSTKNSMPAPGHEEEPFRRAVEQGGAAVRASAPYLLRDRTRRHLRRPTAGSDVRPGNMVRWGRAGGGSTHR